MKKPQPVSQNRVNLSTYANGTIGWEVEASSVEEAKALFCQVRDWVLGGQIAFVPKKVEK